MAAFTFLATYGDNGDIEAVTPVSGEASIPSEGVGVIIQAGVEPHRKVEIIGAVRWLMRGLKNRNIMWQFSGQPIYSGASINSLQARTRWTTSDTSPASGDDVIIGVGFAAAIASGENWTLRMERGFGKILAAIKAHPLQ